MNKAFSLYNGRVTLEFTHNGHRYSVKFDGKTVKPKGVTTLCKDDSSALLGWAVKCAAEKAKEFGLSAEQIAEVKKAHIVERDAKAAYGSSIHKAVEESIVNGGLMPPENGDIVKSFWDVLKGRGLEVVESERAIFSIKYVYAGTFDLLLKDCDGNLILADIKTGNHIFDAWKQMAGYVMAYEEENGAQIHSTAVFHLSGNDFVYKEHNRGMLNDDIAAFKASMFLHQYNQRVNG